MTQLGTIALLGILLGSLLGWKGPGMLRRLGWRIAACCGALFVLLLIIAQLVVWVRQAVAHVPMIVWVALPVAALALAVVALVARGGASSLPFAVALARSPAGGRSVGSGRLVSSFEPLVGKRGGRILIGTPEDTIGIIGPPRSGKTAGILVPQAMMWAGPIISVSVKEDILSAVGNQRAKIAAAAGGGVYIFDPSESARSSLSLLAGGDASLIPTIRWSPIQGCEKADVATLRAEAMVGASITEGGQRNPHFEKRAAMILRTMFHTAALADKTIQDVMRWIDAMDFMEPSRLLAESDSPEKAMWATELLGVGRLGPDERGSCFSTAANCLQAFNMSTVQHNCAHTDFDLRTFVRQRSSLFVISGVAMQKALAPLFSAMLESIAFELIDTLSREHGGRLEPRLLMQIDEIANIAPLPNLVNLLTLCGGRGVCFSYAAQNWKQLGTQYGEDKMRAIWQSTKAQIVFGGVSDYEHLDQMAKLMGRRMERTRSRTKQTLALPLSGSTTIGDREVQRLYGDEIYQLPEGKAYLFYRGRYQVMDVPVYYDRRWGTPFHAAAGWTPGGLIPAGVPA